MVQFVTGYPSRSSVIGKILGESLGEGLGNYVGTHFANKDLERVLADPSLKNAPLSERLSKMESVLGRHGKRGQNLLARRLEIEQVAEKERQAVEDKNRELREEEKTRKESKSLSKILAGQQLDPEEFESLSPKTQIEVLKVMNKPPAGGVSAQPVPPNVQQAIGKVLADSAGSSADELAINMDKAGVPRAFSNAYIESRRRSDESDLKTFDAGSDFETEMLQSYNSYRRDLNTLGQMEQLANKGTLTTPVMASLVEGLGLPIGVLSNPDTEQFDKLSQELVKNIQGTYGNRILKVEVDNFMKSIPTLLNSEEGKKRLIEQWKILNEGKKAYYDAYRDIIRENPKRLPKDYKLQVYDRADAKLDELSQRFLEIGSPKRTKVPVGTKISVDVVDKYLNMAKGDPDLAEKMAREDGYEL